MYWVNEEKSCLLLHLHKSSRTLPIPRIQKLNGVCQWHPKNKYSPLKEKQLLFSLNPFLLTDEEPRDLRFAQPVNSHL